MLTDMPHRPTDAPRFVLRVLAWSLALFGLLRWSWTELHIVLPLTRAQGSVAAGLFGTPSVPVEATLACSGTDALALCLGAVLAYPVRWRTRIAGAVAGTALILGLNTVRIGTLGQAAASPSWFQLLHLYVWPALLTLAIAGYVFGWMRVADRHDVQTAPPDLPGATPVPVGLQPSRRFVLLAGVLLVLFVATSPLYQASATILALGTFIARASAFILGIADVSAHATANTLWTARGGFLVTQECISTPLIPIYVAAVLAYATTWRRVAVGLLATLPLFVALGVARLLIVALPGVVSPLFLVHAFYQLMLGAVIVCIAALWRHGTRLGAVYAVAGILLGALFVYVAGPTYTRLMPFQAGASIADPQGALALLPAFQIGLFLALCAATFVAVRWTWVLGGLAVLGLTQTAGLLALQALAVHAGFTAHVRDIRGWAVAGPVLIFAALAHYDRARR